MNEVNKTLFIPLYGKASVSKKGIILEDTNAEEIWQKEQFPLKGKAKSKWLTYFMAMRAKVFDDWVKQQLEVHAKAAVLHIGCGMDSRFFRLKNVENPWYDVDFPDVIMERKKYFSETEYYHMLCADASKTAWIEELPDFSCVIVVLEGISMYLKNQEVAQLFSALQAKFPCSYILMDVYTTFGAKASKYKNPINEVGVTRVYGIDNPTVVAGKDGIRFVKEHSMTPKNLVNELSGFEKFFFSVMFAGNATKKIYRLFEYETER